MTELTKILHVEDDLDILEIAEMSLSLVGGFDIVQADRGAKALDVIEDFGPQMILIDYQMPGMTGPETLAAIRQLPGYETIPAIFMTAKLQSNEHDSILTEHDLGVIPKPFDPTALPGQILEMWSEGLANAA